MVLLTGKPKGASRPAPSSRGSSASPSPVPSEPSIVQDQHKWTVYNSRVNMPALLNDPRLSRRETDFFSKTWGESFERTVVLPSHFIPNITREHFKRYIKKTSSVCQATYLMYRYEILIRADFIVVCYWFGIDICRG